ncbi:class B sortase [Sellimonas intestinalis]|uniref:class B sortase n=1 Tax=Sellimonas intestinalis TaxID=1653434 RepID=UPI0015EB68FF|nr:class B sortase [Sellimonas intestinalis]MBA2214852.1 class B sortase [Sellimonas intestinalis]
MRNQRRPGWEGFGRYVVRAADGAVNLTLLAAILILLAYGVYGLWDSRQVYAKADSSDYAIYKPEEEKESFDELRAINPEVFGWLTVYGTYIDYPLTQAEDNDKYVNTDAKGAYSLSGSIFLDCVNKKDFSDPVSILYGHDMVEHKMFGDLAEFEKKSYFDSHQYGKVYFEDEWHGIEFFAFLSADAYDKSVYAPGTAAPELPSYVERLKGRAEHVREMEFAPKDHVVLLSTCTKGSTNGRHILAGKITDQVQTDPFEQSGKEKE